MGCSTSGPWLFWSVPPFPLRFSFKSLHTPILPFSLSLARPFKLPPLLQISILSSPCASVGRLSCVAEGRKGLVLVFGELFLLCKATPCLPLARLPPLIRTPGREALFCIFGNQRYRHSPVPVAPPYSRAACPFPCPSSNRFESPSHQVAPCALRYTPAPPPTGFELRAHHIAHLGATWSHI
jgi:hypothetical protein